jgi:hypothetical protein
LNQNRKKNYDKKNLLFELLIFNRILFYGQPDFIGCLVKKNKWETNFIANLGYNDISIVGFLKDKKNIILQTLVW